MDTKKRAVRRLIKLHFCALGFFLSGCANVQETRGLDEARSQNLISEERADEERANSMIASEQIQGHCEVLLKNRPERGVPIEQRRSDWVRYPHEWEVRVGLETRSIIVMNSIFFDLLFGTDYSDVCRQPPYMASKNAQYRISENLALHVNSPDTGQVCGIEFLNFESLIDACATCVENHGDCDRAQDYF